MEVQVVGVALLLGMQGEEQDYTSKQIFSMLGKVCYSYSGIYVGTMGAEGAITPTPPPILAAPPNNSSQNSTYLHIN